MGDPFFLDHRIECEGRSALALAPTAMATVNEQRCRFHAIAQMTAVAAAFEREYGVADHGGVDCEPNV